MESPKFSARLNVRRQTWAATGLSPLLRRKTHLTNLDVSEKYESEIEETDSPDSTSSSNGRRWSFSPISRRKFKEETAKKAFSKRSKSCDDDCEPSSQKLKLQELKARAFSKRSKSCEDDREPSSQTLNLKELKARAERSHSLVTSDKPILSPALKLKQIREQGTNSIRMKRVLESPELKVNGEDIECDQAARKVVSPDKIIEPQKAPINSDQPLAKENEVDASVIDSISTTNSAGIESKVPRSARPHSIPALNHRESLPSFHDRSGSVNSETSLYSELIEAPMVDQEDIIALTHHVRAFSEALGALRNTFFEFSENPDDDPPEVKAHERLGEVLSILKGVLNQYQPLHSTDILAAAGTLINKVKSHNYEDSAKAPEEFCKSIDQLALAFSSSVSDFLMGDQDMSMSTSREHSRSLEDFADDDEDDDIDQEDDYRTNEEELDDDQDDDDYRDDRQVPDKKEPSVDKSAQKAGELDKRLFGLEHGVDLALQRTKVWSKYAKDIATYLERRAHIEQEFTNKLSRLAQTTRASITEDRYLPFQSIYVTALDQDIDYAENCTRTYNALLTSKFLEPLQTRRSNHERRRKELKETWTKAYKKLNEAIVKLEKAKQSYFLKQQEIEKFKSLSDSKDGQELSASFSRTQKKKQDDFRKADEAEEWFKQCVQEANVRQRELMKTKSHVLVELRQLIYQCDQTMKAVTCNFFHSMNLQSTPAPIRFQCLEESSRAYEPGSQFSDFVYDQLTSSQPTVERVFAFEPYQPSTSGSSDKLNRNLHSPTHESGKTSPFTARRSLQISGRDPVRAWGNNLREHMSDGESTGSKSAPVTPEGSPVASRRNRPHQVLDEDSSDDESFSERESRTPRKLKNTSRNDTGPFQNYRMSRAAQTHKFKKLRAPSKCRDCESYVYFNGAECADCGLTCHRKCLARLKNHCDSKFNGTGNRGSNYNVGRRMTTFGVDFNSHLRATQKHGEYVPYIVSLCVDELDRRGLQYKGIYRVCGVKSKVEKVCQAFENSNRKVDLQEIQPHVIAAVLKLYLRQLPEPLLTFKLYPEFVRIAKESLETSQNASQEEGGNTTSEEIVHKLREVVVRLPKANFRTAAKIIGHLKLVADNEEDNQMSACNLGIVFGPTLLRPWESASSDSVSMPALVDMPHQTKAVELLINNPQVFDEPGVDDPASQETPVEEFSSVDRDKNGNDLQIVCSTRNKDGRAQLSNVTTNDKSSLLNIPVTSKRLRKSSSPASDIPQEDPDSNLFDQDNLVQPVEPEKTVIPVDAMTRSSRNKLGSQITPVPRSSGIAGSVSSSSTKTGDGLGKEFFDLLEKSNKRTENKNGHHYSLPEFLLPGTTEENENEVNDNKDVDDSYDDSTQGTSGSRTPDDDLHSSRGSLGRDSFIPTPDSMIEESPVNQRESRDLLPTSLMSRSSSAYSMSVSFGSDAQDEKLLPDFSEAEPSEQEKLENFMVSQSDEIPTKSVDDLSVPSPNRPRPGSLGLLKRNSDLPGMMSRINFFPVNSKTSDGTSLLKESTKQTAEPNSTTGSRKHRGIADALSEMHVIYDPLIPHADTLKPNSQPPITEEKSSSFVVVETTVVDAPLEDEEVKDEHESGIQEEWYMTEQEEINQSDAKENTLEYQSPNEKLQENLQEITCEEPSLDLSIPEQLEEKTEMPENSAENEEPKSPPPLAEKPSFKIIDAEGNAFDKKTRNPTRVSVKDRLRQYEQSPEKTDSVRKTPSPPVTGMIDISSRKQVFENIEKGETKESFRRLQDGSKQAKSIVDVEFTKYDDRTSVESREQKGASFESLETQKQKEPLGFKSRKVDIPLDYAGFEAESFPDRKKTLLTSINSFPLRTSPKQSRRSPRRQFPEDSSNEDREPQFV